MQPDTPVARAQNLREGLHVHIHTRTVLHWLQIGGAQNAHKFPINLHTRAHSGQRKTGRPSYRCDSQYQHSSSCDTT